MESRWDSAGSGYTKQNAHVLQRATLKQQTGSKQKKLDDAFSHLKNKLRNSH